MNIEIATGIIFVLVAVAGLSTTTASARTWPLATSVAMAVGGAALLLIARLAPEHAPGSTRDEGMHALHDGIGLALLAGGLLQSWGATKKIRVLEATRSYALAATGILVALDSQMHGSDQLRIAISLALIQAALIELAQYLAREEARVLGTLAWLLVAAAGVAFMVFGAGEGSAPASHAASVQPRPAVSANST